MRGNRCCKIQFIVMKTLFRWIFRLFLVTLLLAIAFLLLLNTLAKEWLEHTIRVKTGLETRIEQVEIGLLNPVIHLEKIKLYNPPQFGGAPFLDFPEVHIEYDRAALISGRWHLRLLRLTLQEIHVMEDANGRLNLESAGPPVLETLLPAKSGSNSRFAPAFAGIDQLNLTLRKFRYNSLKNPQSMADLDIGLEHHIVSGIRNREQLIEVLDKIARERGLGNLADSLRADKRSQPSASRQPRIILGPANR